MILVTLTVLVSVIVFISVLVTLTVLVSLTVFISTLVSLTVLVQAIGQLYSVSIKLLIPLQVLVFALVGRTADRLTVN